MRTLGTLLSYVAGVAAVAGAAVLAVNFLTPVAATTQQGAEVNLSSSPRIAAWQERIAEEKVYAERAAARDAEEKARWAALGKPPMTQVVKEEPPSRDVDDRERARAEKAQRDAIRRAQQAYAQQTAENPFAFGARSYAPEPSHPRYNYVFSTMRESRGGN
jgi:hypothetical protein